MRKSIRFYDDVNFPKGFNRKGFTIKEAAILDDYGLTMKALLNATLTPESEEEHLFLYGVRNEDSSASFFVHCWLKYINLITTKTKIYTLCGTPYPNDDNTTPEMIEEDIEEPST